MPGKATIPHFSHKSKEGYPAVTLFGNFRKANYIAL